jgi:hypothetical protein
MSANGNMSPLGVGTRRGAMLVSRAKHAAARLSGAGEIDEAALDVGMYELHA